ncbi:MAG: Y-family DNA polymerase [Bacteroidales bacterium]|nr:Y-family DNA polymerase [Bacteroidales bacterium]
MYVLVDCNNFYASCERVFNPDLNGKPIVVLSNNDGCVVARSSEAKALGIPMGSPAFESKELFEKNNVLVFSSNYALYGDMSARVMTILSNYTPDIEIYSIDEAFLKFDGFEYLNLIECGKTIKEKVNKSTGIPVSIGIALTKALSKVANRIAKKFPDKTGGVYIIDTEEKRIKALKWLAIEDVWGIGRKYAKKLRSYGINNAFQFTQQSDSWIKKQMSIVGIRLKKDLEGIPTIAKEEIKSKKTISITRTFEKNITDYNLIKERIVTFAVTCAEKLRNQNTYCNVVIVFVHSNYHRNDLQQYSNSTVVKLPFSTNSSIEIAKFAVKGLENIFIKGIKYKKAGVIAMDITPDNNRQLSIFENSNPKHIPLMKTIDIINASIGKHKIKLASQDQNRIWKMKQEKLSKKFTTRLTDVIEIKV